MWRTQRPLGWSLIWGMTPHPPGGWRQPLPRERPLLEQSQAGPMPGSQRLPTPHWGALPPPLPPRSGCSSSHSVFIIVLTLHPLPSPWEEAAGWQPGRNPLSPLWAPVSRPLICTWTPCAAVRPLRDLAPTEAAPIPASHRQGPRGLWLVTPAFQGLTPSESGGQSRGEGWSQERQKGQVGGLQGENNSIELPSQANHHN